MAAQVLKQVSARVRRLVRLLAPEKGQGLVEYALILVFIAMVVIIIVQVLGHQVNNVFSNISNGLSQ